ncbi:MAG: hypothetical protein FD145_1173 [Candidatus Saganbacteria bacterium]|uniref:Uncharacterized protein n=1 Tax=Candidatus Saganbacteria bacterium TaxID=2575572 RepID=A0A833L345_UNCSA|nr:MAG: hypothetical protein FD145_1173 [Candidatus Saganbacteria bacterium]
MANIETFFRSHKIIFLFYAVVASPFMLVWAVVYGLIIGVIGPTVDIFEIIRNRTYQDVRTVLKYPGWKAEFYKISSLKAMDNMPEKMRENRKAFEEGRKKAPEPIGYLLRNIAAFSIYYPAFLIWGIITGPIRAFAEYLKWCYKVWTGQWYVPI